MILTVFHGFCMALVDSVPGVSGGTLASIPFIAAAERTTLKRLRGALFALLDMAVVVLTLLRGSSALGSVSFASLSPLSLLYIFSSSSTNASGSKGAPSSRIRTIRLPSSKRRQHHRPRRLPEVLCRSHGGWPGSKRFGHAAAS